MAQRYRVLLVYPPSRTQLHGSCPVGPLALAAVLERAGHEVHVLDANAARRPLSSAGVATAAAKLRPDVVGITLLTPLAREAYRLASLLRCSGARLLAGGPHATLVPQEPLAHGFDAVVVGEGEPVVDAAVRALMGDMALKDVPSLTYRDGDGALRATPRCPPPVDLDALPFPARHLVDPDHYDGTEPTDTLFSSRGCSARCTYCAGGLFGKRFRFRSAASVLTEMREVHELRGTPHFHFADDAMSMSRARMREICLAIRDAKLPITWSMMTRIDGVDEEMLRLAADSGCTRIDYGVESGSRATLRRIRKPHTPEMVRRIVPLTASLGIKPNVFFILGFPWEDVAAIEETRALMEELVPYVAKFHPAIGSVLIPFPGTEIYETYKDVYGFGAWWLGDERNFDVPTPRTHAYYEQVAFRSGAVLDADFFRYSPDVRRKIVDVFGFMYAQNLRSRRAVMRTAHQLAFSVSAALAPRWPRFERTLFSQFGRRAGPGTSRDGARVRC